MGETLFPMVQVMNKKVVKKHKRKEAMFMKREAHLGVVFQDLPSVHVLVGNGGLAHGVTRVLLEEILGTQDVYMLPDKEYAFATFSSVSQAMAVVDTVSGVCLQVIPNIDLAHLPWLVAGPPLHLYLSYITSIPPPVLVVATHPPPPPGLALIHNFITAAEEEELMTFFNSAHTSHSHLKHRQVLHYGYEFNYDTNNVDIHSPLPGGFPLLIQHLVTKVAGSEHVHNTPDQITVNVYPPGAGIPPHVDTHSAFMEEIISLSLGSQVVMDFRLVSQSSGRIEEKVPVLLPARSLLVLSGQARYLWTHGIATRHYDQVQDKVAMTTVPRGVRISLTFRTVCKHPNICTCEYPLHCDSQGKDHSTMANAIHETEGVNTC